MLYSMYNSNVFLRAAFVSKLNPTIPWSKTAAWLKANNKYVINHFGVVDVIWNLGTCDVFDLGYRP